MARVRMRILIALQLVFSARSLFVFRLEKGRLEIKWYRPRLKTSKNTLAFLTRSNYS